MTLLGQQLDGTVGWFCFIVFEKVSLSYNFYIHWYLPALLDPIRASVKSFDVNFQVGTISNDSLK